MPGVDFILGLPDIVSSFLDLLISMLRKQRECVMNVNNSEEVYEVPLWSDGVVEEAPEDMDTPMPCAFESVLRFMEVPYEEARAEYFELLKTHIGEALRGSPEVLAVLKDELAVGRFVPQEWTGIRGVEPLDLQVKAER